MEKPLEAVNGAEVSHKDLAAVITSLEPDQLSSAKAKHHCPRRRLTHKEIIIFWALRVYLVFMLVVLMYQVWTGAR